MSYRLKFFYYKTHKLLNRIVIVLVSMSLLKALIGIVIAIITFLIASWGKDNNNNFIMVIFFLIAVVAFFYAIYEWKKGD